MNDEGILWQVNFSRFHQHFIDEVRANALIIRLETKLQRGKIAVTFPSLSFIV